jgi:hypothetical protein
MVMEQIVKKMFWSKRLLLTKVIHLKLCKKPMRYFRVPENLEEDFEKTYHDKESLWKCNLDLKKENQTLKDSVEIISNELKVIQIRLKEAKKRNLIQRVFNMTPDTIETIVLDTIQ